MNVYIYIYPHLSLCRFIIPVNKMYVLSKAWGLDIKLRPILGKNAWSERLLRRK